MKMARIPYDPPWRTRLADGAISNNASAKADPTVNDAHSRRLSFARIRAITPLPPIRPKHNCSSPAPAFNWMRIVRAWPAISLASKSIGMR